MSDPFWRRFGAVVTMRRAADGVATPTQLARKAGMHNETVARLELGEPSRTDTIEKVALGLGTTVEALMREAVGADSVQAAPRERGAVASLMPSSRLSPFERVQGLLAVLEDWQYDEAFRLLRDHFMLIPVHPEEDSTPDTPAGAARP